MGVPFPAKVVASSLRWTKVRYLVMLVSPDLTVPIAVFTATPCMQNCVLAMLVIEEY